MARSSGNEGGRPKIDDPREDCLKNLDFDSAHELLFPKGLLPTYTEVGGQSKQLWDEWFPPPKWPRGKPPKDQTEDLQFLDDTIAAAKLRSQDDLNEVLIPDKLRARRIAQSIEACPFYSARYLLCGSVQQARAKFEAQREILAASKIAVPSVENAISQLEKLWGNKIKVHKLQTPYYAAGVTYTPSDAEQEEKALYEKHSENILRIPSIIESLKYFLDYSKCLSPEKSPVSWRSLFIEELAHLWVELSTTLPSSSNSPFITFVSAALGALGETRGATENEVRTVIARIEGVKGVGGRPVWNRRDGVLRWRRGEK